jgi:hypothetical protein
MFEDSIQKASSVEVVGSRKRGLLRPVTTKGDSFLAEHDEDTTRDDDSALKASISTARSRPSPAPRGASYQPDCTQDADNTPVQSGTMHDVGSSEDRKDVLRMGITQEMRVS